MNEIKRTEIGVMLERNMNELSAKENIPIQTIIDVFRSEVFPLNDISVEYYKKHEAPSKEKLNELVDDLLYNLCSYFDVDLEEVKGISRNANLVGVRTVFSYLSQNMFDWGCNPIRIVAARLRRDRTSIYHHIGKFVDLYEYDKPFRDKIRNFLIKYYNVSEVNKIENKMSYNTKNTEDER